MNELQKSIIYLNGVGPNRHSLLKSEFGINLKCKYLAGHSLGEYSALVCANSLSFEDALLLLQKRGKFMQEAVPVGQGSMLAVLGCEIKKLNEIISNLKEDGVCEIANDNADGQVIISGHSEKIKKLQSFLKINKIKSIALPVSAPFHCSLMKQASEKMKFEIESTIFNKPQIDIINNVTASIETSPVNIKDLLVRQIFSPVKWRETILKMEKDGITDFIEIGPGKVLSGLVKRIIKNALTININSVEDIKKFLK